MLVHRGIPACFPSAQSWERYRDVAKYGGGHYSMCTDCTPEYQADMLREMKCAHQEIEFRKDEDGFIEGYRPAQTEWQKKAERIVARAQSGVVHVYAERTFHAGEERRVLRIVREGEPAKMNKTFFVGAYGPGADIETVAEDLKAAA